MSDTIQLVVECVLAVLGFLLAYNFQDIVRSLKGIRV